MIDKNSMEELTNYRRLWRNVIIQVARDACTNAQESYDAYMWSKSKEGKIVFDLAGIDSNGIEKILSELYQDEEKRKLLSQKMMYARSKHYVQFIQPNLFDL